MLYRQPFTDLVSITSHVTRGFVRFWTPIQQTSSTRDPRPNIISLKLLSDLPSANGQVKAPPSRYLSFTNKEITAFSGRLKRSTIHRTLNSVVLPSQHVADFLKQCVLKISIRVRVDVPCHATKDHELFKEHSTSRFSFFIRD